MAILDITPILTKQSLVEKVEFLVSKDKMRYSEALIHICSELAIDPEDIVKLITPALKSKIETEAKARNILPRTGNTFSLDSFANAD
jgi:hypothetical protein